MEENEVLRSLQVAAKAFRSGRGGVAKFRSREGIKQARLKLEMTQEEFADTLGVSIQAVRSWEQGTRKPGILSLATLSTVFAKKGEPAGVA